MFTVAGLTQKFTDILTYRYVDPGTFNADDTSQVSGEGGGGQHILLGFSASTFDLLFTLSLVSDFSPQVQIYRALVAVFKQVVDDIDTDFKPHNKAQFWQRNLQKRIHEFLDGDNLSDDDVNDVQNKVEVNERSFEREKG